MNLPENSDNWKLGLEKNFEMAGNLLKKNSKYIEKLLWKKVTTYRF